jgi:peptide methionine sulfoxide reductase MsrA
MEPLIFVVSRREQLVSRRDIDTKLWRSNLFIDTEPKHQQHRAKNPDGSGR